jgi:hypothetical protein
MITVMRPVAGSISTRSGLSPARRGFERAGDLALIEPILGALGHSD